MALCEAFTPLDFPPKVFFNYIYINITINYYFKISNMLIDIFIFIFFFFPSQFLNVSNFYIQHLKNITPN